MRRKTKINRDQTLRFLARPGLDWNELLCGTVGEVDNRNLRDSLFNRLKDMLDFFNRVSRQNNFTTLFAFHAGNIFDDDDTILELNCVNGRTGLHFALAEKAGRSY